jgi:hypothetical protein
MKLPLSVVMVDANLMKRHQEAILTGSAIHRLGFPALHRYPEIESHFCWYDITVGTGKAYIQLNLARSYRPRLMLAPAVPRVLAPRGLV